MRRECLEGLSHLLSVTSHRSQVGDFEVRVFVSECETCLDLVGELDVFGGEFFSETIHEILSTNPGCSDVSLDLGRVSFIDVAGIRTLNSVCDWLNSLGCTVAVQSVSSHIERVASMAAMDLPSH